MSAKGLIRIDAIDIWEAYGMFVMSGTNDLLKMPARKEPITHDWQDSNGLDVDTSRVFFEARDISLKMGFKSGNLTDFWDKYTKFLSLMAKPYLRRLEIVEFGKSYFVYYKSCSDYKRYKKVVNDSICEFTLVLSEPNPQIDSSPTFIIDEAGRFLIT